MVWLGALAAFARYSLKPAWHCPVYCSTERALHNSAGIMVMQQHQTKPQLQSARPALKRVCVQATNPLALHTHHTYTHRRISKSHIYTARLHLPLHVLWGQCCNPDPPSRTLPSWPLGSACTNTNTSLPPKKRRHSVINRTAQQPACCPTALAARDPKQSSAAGTPQPPTQACLQQQDKGRPPEPYITIMTKGPTPCKAQRGTRSYTNPITQELQQQQYPSPQPLPV